MKKQTFQHAEIRDENDNIISSGAYGKNTALSNKQNDGWIDYVMNNLECLYEQKSSVDTSNFVTHAELTRATSGLANKSSLAAFATKKEADGRYLQKTDKIDAYTKAESDAKYQLKGTYASVEYVDGRVANIVNSAPETLDTLQELAQALGNDPNFATTVAKEIGTKADKATTENALKGKANAADVYTKTESNERYQPKGGASVEAFYQWLKERNYDLTDFLGLESIFPIVKLAPIKIDTVEDGQTWIAGTAPPNVTIMYGGKAAISDSDGRWRLPAVPDPNAAEVTIQWVDYAGRTHTEKIPVIFKKYCIPIGIQIVTQSIAEKYELNKPENLEFPASVTQIEERALYNYAQITGAAAPNCEYVGTKAFCGCSQLKSVSLPACITLANDAFFQCSNLTKISLPECTKIASWAFHGCVRLVSVSIPKCADIDNFVFDECKSLRTVILSENWVPNGGVKIPTTATVYNANKTKKVNWNTMSWVRA